MARKKVNEIKHWQPILIFDKMCMFTPDRVDKDSVPKGFYMYETRHWDEDWGLMCQIGPWICVNFFGTVISNEPIPIVEWDYQRLNVRNGEDYRYEDMDGVHMVSDIIDVYYGDELDEMEWLNTFDAYTAYKDTSKWEIPDECIENDIDVLLVHSWYEGVLDNISNAVDYKSKSWRRKIIVDIDTMNAKQINRIREIMYKVRDMYKEKSSLYEQERIVYTARPLTDEEFEERKSAMEKWTHDQVSK